MKAALEMLIQQICKNCPITDCSECLYFKEAMEGQTKRIEEYNVKTDSMEERIIARIEELRKECKQCSKQPICGQYYCDSRYECLTSCLEILEKYRRR